MSDAASDSCPSIASADTESSGTKTELKDDLVSGMHVRDAKNQNWTYAACFGNMDVNALFNIFAYLGPSGVGAIASTCAFLPACLWVALACTVRRASRYRIFVASVSWVGVLLWARHQHGSAATGEQSPLIEYKSNSDTNPGTTLGSRIDQRIPALGNRLCRHSTAHYTMRLRCGVRCGGQKFTLLPVIFPGVFTTLRGGVVQRYLQACPYARR